MKGILITGYGLKKRKKELKIMDENNNNYNVQETGCQSGANAVSLYQKLSAVQQEMNIPKSGWNDFGGYAYRSAEMIYETAKPICAKHGATFFLNDVVESHGNAVFTRAIATFVDIDTGEKISVSGYARQADRKGMSAEQTSGAASSYARKYALCGLFLLDDNKDPDGNGGSKRETEERAQQYSNQSNQNGYSAPQNGGYGGYDGYNNNNGYNNGNGYDSGYNYNGNNGGYNNY